MNPVLSIVLPAHNEADRLPVCLNTLTDWIWNYTHFKTEIIIVENGSTDRTMDIAWEWSLKWAMIQKPWHIDQRSKAAAVRKGMLEARGQYVMMADVDLSMPLEEIKKYILYIVGGYDVVIGSRYMPKSHLKQSIRRSISSHLFRSITSLVIPEIRDTQCGFKMFKREAAVELFHDLKTNSMAFDVEILLEARRRGYRIHELPITWIENKDSRVHMLRDALRMSQDVYRLWRKEVRYRAASHAVVIRAQI
jgi:dolichyl-phosphate beta-glucosyltransferase